VERLPALADEVASEWGLVIESTSVRCGYHCVVLPVRRGETPLVLKLRWPEAAVKDEADALAAWRGHGAVELERSIPARGALLLERLDPDATLSVVPIDEAVEIAGRLIRTLAIPTTATFLSTQLEASRLSASLASRQRALGDPVPARWLEHAIRVADELTTSKTSLLVHADLHFGNVLKRDQAQDVWAAIDPKPRIGDPERSVAELLWTRVDELAGAPRIVSVLETLIEAGDLDLGRAMSWAFVRAIEYWLWALDAGLTEDPTRCARVADALVAELG
jgi:streptomycin 6-kinase